VQPFDALGVNPSARSGCCGRVGYC
jgi:hypothetical protein